MFNTFTMTRKRRMKKQPQRHQPLFSCKSMACHLPLRHPQQCQRQSGSSPYKSTTLCAIMAVVCMLTLHSQSVSATPTATTNNNNNIIIKNTNSHLFRNSHQLRGARGIGNVPLGNIGPNNNNYHFLEQQNEYDSSSSGVSILDDDTLKLSLTIDEDTVGGGGGGLSAPSLHILEPKVFLRVSGESGMIKPEEENSPAQNQQKQSSNNNEVVIRRSFRFPDFRASSSPPLPSGKHEEQGADLHNYQSNDEEDHEPVGGEEEEEDDESDNYHHHFPYIESYREKYVKPDFDPLGPSVAETTITSTPPPPTFQPTTITASKKASSSSSASKTKQQEWTDLIAQVTTPSSLNEINPSASEHRLADFHFRANLPAYFYNKYSAYSEEDLENVADLDDEHSKYFVKTRPRSVTTAGSNIYSNFYYEPPSFSTKSVPIPVKTNREKVVFASAKPTEDPHQLYTTTATRTDEENKDHRGGHIYLGDHDEEAQQDSPVMSALSSNFTSHNVPILTPQQINYDREVEGRAANHNNKENNDNYSNESLLRNSDSSAAALNRNQARKQQQTAIDNYYKNHQNHTASSQSTDAATKSSAETLDVSTSQSVLSKVTLNNPHHPQLVIIKAEPIKTTLATPGHEIVTSAVVDDDVFEHNDDADRSSDDEVVNTSPPEEANGISDNLSSSTPATITTTTDATSIPGIPGIDYPTLGEIPQTGFDCQKQRYKGFFADIDTKCQAWHYCDFTDGHSTFLCPNGTLFSQVLLTCDWWFNVDCNQARQLYVLNERLYRYIKPPKPSFPEDFIGEHVDKWLLQQFTNGYLPKVRKKSKAKFVNLPPPVPTSAEVTTPKNETDV